MMPPRTAPRLLPLTLVLMVMAIAARVGPARAQSGMTGVYYDYAQVSIGGVPQFVLIPRSTEVFRQDSPPQVAIPEAFRVLRDNKRATYGNASLTLTDDDIAAGRVVVHIDPEQRQWFQIVAAETVYTFTGLGVDEVVFPGVSEEPWNRSQVPFAAFVLHVPLWRALPPARMEGAFIELPDGSRLQATDFYRRWDQGDRELQRMVLSYLSDGGTIEQRGVLSALPDLSIEGAEEAVASALDSPSAEVRLLAIEYLGPRGAALERLAGLVESDPDSAVRAAAAEALGSTGDSHYAFLELVHALEETDTDRLPEALSALAATGDPRATNELIPYLASDQEAVRQAAIDGLIALGDVERLLAAAQEMGSAGLMGAVTTTLAEGEDATLRIRGLEMIIAGQSGAAAVGTLERIAAENGVSAEATRQVIERQLVHPSEPVRIAAAQTLGGLGSVESLEPLSQAAATESEMSAQMAVDEAAREILAGLPIDDLIELAEGRDVFRKRGAYRALGQLARDGRAGRNVLELLLAGIDDPEPQVRGAAILGLSAFTDDPGALEAITRAASDPEAYVRRDAAAALGRFPAEQTGEMLLSLLDDSDPRVEAAAIQSLGGQGHTELLPMLLERTGASSPHVRAAAAQAASLLSTPESEQVVIDALMGATNDRDETVRAAAAGALSHFDSELAVLGISPLTQDTSRSVRLRAIEALGQTGNLAAVSLLTGLLFDPEPEIRAAAAAALAELGRAEAVPELERVLTDESDPLVREALTRALGELQ